MSNKLKRYIWSLAGFIALFVTVWWALQPVVIISPLSELPVPTRGKNAPLNQLSWSSERAASGGSRGHQVALDAANTAYTLGVRGSDHNLFLDEAVVVTPPNGAQSRVVRLGRTRNPDWQLHSDAFVVSPSGQKWWTAASGRTWIGRFDDMPDTPYLDAVRVYRPDGSLQQEWAAKRDGLGLLLGGNDKNAYVADEGGAVWIYTIGQPAPRRFYYSVQTGSILDDNLDLWEMSTSSGPRELNVTATPILNLDSKRARKFKIPYEAVNLLFWSDVNKGCYFVDYIGPNAPGGPFRAYAIKVLSPAGELNTLLQIPHYALALEEDGYTACKWLKVENDVVFVAVFNTSALGSSPTRFRIMRLQARPRWRTWVSS